MSWSRRASGFAAAMALTLLQLGWPSAVRADTDPVIRDDAYTMWEDEALKISPPGVLANDTPGQSGYLSNRLCVVSWADSAIGSPSLGLPIGYAHVYGFSDDGGFGVTVTADAYGEPVLTYKAAAYGLHGSCPGPGVTTEWKGRVRLTIIPVNDRPSISIDTIAPIRVEEDSGPRVVTPFASVLSWGAHEIDTVKEWIVTTPDPELFATGPSVVEVFDSPAHVGLRFTTAPNANGSTDVLIKVRDSGGTEHGGIDVSYAHMVMVQIEPVPDPPTAVADSYSVTAGTTLRVAEPGVLANDDDVDGDALTATLGSFPAHGSLSMTPDGSFEYRPDAGFVGKDSFAYRASDGTFTTGLTTVSISVRAASAPSPSSGPSTRPATPPPTGKPPQLTGTPPPSTSAAGSSAGPLASPPPEPTVEATSEPAIPTGIEPPLEASPVAVAGLGSGSAAPDARPFWALAIGLLLLVVAILAIWPRIRAARTP